MYDVRNIVEDIIWVGTNDKRLTLFENMFPIPEGVSYNSYIINDEKTALLDTVDNATRNTFLENINKILNGKALDYLIINHMEPDHCGIIPDIMALYPNIELVSSQKGFELLKAFYPWAKDTKKVVIKEGSTLSLGKHNLTFCTMPMVHWPEVTAVYESKTKILFSADAFGSFGTLNGNIFDDEVDFERRFLENARRYYANIVGKYGPQVGRVFEKLAGLDIKCIAPLHGPIWKENLGYILEKYKLWSSYTPEKKGITIVYASMYGNTENLAQHLSTKLAEKGIKDIEMFDISNTDSSYIVNSIWKNSHIIFAAPTYNADLYPNMRSLLTKLEYVGFQNKSRPFRKLFLE
jgi:flavorubredoxin